MVAVLPLLGDAFRSVFGNFGAYLRSVAPFALLAAVLGVLPLLADNAMQGASLGLGAGTAAYAVATAYGQVDTGLLAFVLAIVGAEVAQTLALGAGLVVTAQVARGQPAGARSSMEALGLRLLPLLGVRAVIFLAGTAVAGTLVIPGILLFGDAPALGLLLVLIGFALILVISLVWLLGEPAAVLGGRGVRDSLGQSRRLTGGIRLNLFGALILMGVYAWAVSLLAMPLHTIATVALQKGVVTVGSGLLAVAQAAAGFLTTAVLAAFLAHVYLVGTRDQAVAVGPRAKAAMPDAIPVGAGLVAPASGGPALGEPETVGGAVPTSLPPRVAPAQAAGPDDAVCTDDLAEANRLVQAGRRVWLVPETQDEQGLLEAFAAGVERVILEPASQAVAVADPESVALLVEGAAAPDEVEEGAVVLADFADVAAGIAPVYVRSGGGWELRGR